jgi:histidine ammonia-lyase
VIALDGGKLTAADIVAIAHREGSVEVTPEARARVAASHEFAARVAAERPIYGRATGVGANRNQPVDDPASHARALLRSHATSAGPPRSPERIRAMLGVRLNQLAAGGSGASPAVLDGLLAMLDADALPRVRELGSIGTGDLSALATAALALAGEGATSNPLPVVVAFGVDDALPFLSSNAATIGDAALALVELQGLARAAVVVAALTFAAVDGNAEAFAEAVERVTPFAGAQVVARQMRALVGSGRAPTTQARIQDSFGLRVLPQVHGALVDALGRLDDVVTAMANAPSENPVALPDVGLAHHGGFHAAYLVQALDGVTTALAQSAQLNLARIGMLNEPTVTTLPPFLGDGTAGASGVMVVEYVAASALGSLRALATPAGLQSVTLSRGVEDDATFASLAAFNAIAAAQTYRTLLACELVAAVRAVRMRGLDLAAPPLKAVMSVCAPLDPATDDRDLTADIDVATTLIGSLAKLA